MIKHTEIYLESQHGNLNTWTKKLWKQITKEEKLCPVFIRDHLKKLDWNLISQYQTHLCDDFWVEWNRSVQWNLLFQKKKCSDKFLMRIMESKFVSPRVSVWMATHQKLSVSLMRRFKQRFGPLTLLMCQTIEDDGLFLELQRDHRHHVVKKLLQHQPMRYTEICEEWNVDLGELFETVPDYILKYVRMSQEDL